AATALEAGDIVNPNKESLMKKTFVVAMALAVLSLLTMIQPAFSKGKGVQELVGEHSTWAHGLVNSKSFSNKTVLIEVMDQRKSTKIGDLLDTVDSVLSSSQRSIFVDPILLAEHQNISYVTVEVDGAVLANLGLKDQAPADQKGVA